MAESFVITKMSFPLLSDFHSELAIPPTLLNVSSAKRFHLEYQGDSASMAIAHLLY